MIFFIVPWLTDYKLELIENISFKTKSDIKILSGKSPSHKAINSVSKSKHVDISDINVFSFIKVLLKKNRQTIFMLHLRNLNSIIYYLILTCLKGEVYVWESGYVAHDRFKNLIMKIKTYLMNRADKVFFYSKSGEKRYQSIGLKTKSVVVNNTVKSLATPSDIFDKKIKNNKLKFLYVGGISKLKSIDILLDAFIKWSNNNINCNLNIVGPILKAERDYFVQRFNKIKNVIYHGPLYHNELKQEWLNNDCFILPGIGGLSVNEALSYGLPAITTVGDGTIADFIITNHNGFLIDGTTESVVNGFDWYANLSEKERNQIINNCLQTYSDKLKYEFMVDKFTKTLNS